MIDAAVQPKVELPTTSQSLRRKRRIPKTLLWGLCMLGVLLALVVVFPLVSSLDPIQQDLSNRFAPPSPAHILGTDNFGRDVFIRIVVGGRVDLEVAVIATVLSMMVGIVLGLWAGFFGGWIDALLMRLVDMTLAFPMIVLVIAIVAMLGPGIINMFIAIVVISWVYYARLTRAEVLVVKNKEYVQAARALGASSGLIIFRHVLPNVVSGAVVYGASDAVLNIIFAGTLGYLGLGIQAPAPEWGAMVAASQAFLKTAPTLLIFPSIAILLAGIAFSLIGDGLADLLRKGGVA